jgi:DNA-directed RNA polymerases I, II, and III subunit RPABC2
MSDLEQSDIENISDDEDSVSEPSNSIKPTFSTTTKKEGNLVTDIKQVLQKADAVVEYSDDDEDVDDDADDDADADDDDDDDDDDESILKSDDDDVDDDMSIDEESGIINKKSKPTKPTIVKKTTKTNDELPTTTTLDIPVDFEKNDSDYESGEDEEEDDDYLQKFDKEVREDYIIQQHPESINHNYDEIYNLAKVQRNKDNIIVDSLHKTIPILTKYEKTRILGQRAKQLNNGARPLVKLSTQIIDGYLIALKELEEKKIPVIIRRPLPGGASEYWHLKDLEILC